MEPVQNHELRTLITGASSGIGRQTAVRLSASRSLIICGRDAQRLQQTRELCVRPENHTIWVQDLSDPSQIESGLQSLLGERSLQIREFVHCAGVLSVRPFRTVSLAEFQAVMNVNFFAAAEIVRQLIRQRVNSDHLRNVVLVSSTASQYGARGFGVYSASKGALDSLMRSLAVELAPRVRLNSVLPGAVRTEMTAGILSDEPVAERMKAQYPLGFGEVDDVAAVIEFLLSDSARWVTGQQFVVDGGRTINITG
ncbi:MAG: SDR family NAD(P)-dependent oxidoreductase [Planctomyces sp.]